MIKLNWQGMVLGCWLLTFSIVVAGCASLQGSPEKKSSLMQEYAQARYEKALSYMEDSRFELAQEQFAVVAATAESSELRVLAQEGYAKAGKTIASKR